MYPRFYRVQGGLIKLDLTDFAATKSLLEEKRPTYLVHAAAQRFPDQVSDTNCRINSKPFNLINQ